MPATVVGWVFRDGPSGFRLVRSEATSFFGCLILIKRSNEGSIGGAFRSDQRERGI